MSAALGLMGEKHHRFKVRSIQILFIVNVSVERDNDSFSFTLRMKVFVNCMRKMFPSCEKILLDISFNCVQKEIKLLLSFLLCRIFY
jgi:hypothetical protein